LGRVLGASAQVAVPPTCFVPPLGTPPDFGDEVVDGDELHAARRSAPTATDATIVPRPVSRRTLSLALVLPAPNIGM
jgi:hypothetical protein